MKRKDLLRHLGQHGCKLLREGKRHSIYWNPALRKTLTSSIPRHSEINDFLAKKICRDPGIPEY